MTRVFVFTDHKGGVGKSTSATNIAFGITGMLHRANASNCRVLLIDTALCDSCRPLLSTATAPTSLHVH